MIVTIWRHGEAGLAVTDEVRELTGSGRDDVSYGCHQINEHCQSHDLPAPSRVLHSPLVRTTQTAEIIDAAFSPATMATVDALVPGGGIEEVESLVMAEFDGATPPDHLVLVSHQPLVTYLLDRWLGQRGLVPSLSPSGYACIEMDVPGEGCATLQFWSFPPVFEAGH